MPIGTLAQQIVRGTSFFASASAQVQQEIVDALTHDLAVQADHAQLAKERLMKVEAQTRVLAEAVIAMATKPAEEVASAINAVKLAM